MRLQQVSPLRNGRRLFSPIDLTVEPGSISVLMGPSGIGKSSLLDSISGGLDYTGIIDVPGKCFRVYQDHNQLFPWMTVRRNLGLANPESDWNHILGRWQLDGFLDRYPTVCSVGQQQRITLLRAIHSDKPVLLCDEPLSGVDRKTAASILDFFLSEIQHTSKRVIWVTHNRDEALHLGNIIEIKS